MPDYLFRPIARVHPKANFQTVQAIADEFDTSRTATAIRLVEGKYFVALLVCHGPEGRKWFTRSPDIPPRWFPSKNLSADSFAFTVLFGVAPEDKFPRKIGADAWFDHREADRYEVYEQTIRTRDDEILSVILVADEAMLRDHG